MMITSCFLIVKVSQHQPEAAEADGPRRRSFDECL
jgi:hypothetical protein